VRRFTPESGIPSFPRQNVTPAASKPGRESSTGTHTPHRPFRSARVPAFAGTTPGNGPVDGL
jgi:hypothetical protein